MQSTAWTSRKLFLTVGLLLVVSLLGSLTWIRSQRTDHQPDAAAKARLSAAYTQLPMSFEANVGQVDPQVDFISRGSGYTLFLTPREAVLALRNQKESAAVLRMKFVGSEAKPRATGREELRGKVNYVVGKDRKQWRTGVSTYAKVAYENLYPGIDLVYYGNQRQLEYDFVVQPGTEPDVIGLSFEGADQLKVDAQGELVMKADGNEIRQRKPFIYQEVDGVRREVAGNYKLKDTNTVGFEVAEYDASKPLVIDPVLVYSTFLGSPPFDEGFGITVDAAGNAYVTGQTLQLSTPSIFPTISGAFDTTHNGAQDVFVTKLNASGSALIYSTFIGGSDNDGGSAIALDSTGNVYVTGSTSSSDFPTTAGAFDTTHSDQPGPDAFVLKLNASGSALVYSTYLGSFEQDAGHSIAVDDAGNAYVSGDTRSSGFPITPGAFDPAHNGNDDPEVFVTKLNPTGTALIYSTFLGVSSGGFIAIDPAGNAYVSGSASPGFPTTVGAFDTTHNGGGDIFVTKLNPTGSALVYSTFIGGDANEEGHALALDASGSVYVTGNTTSSNYPTTAGAFDTSYNGNFDAVVTKLNATGSALVYSTYLGDVDFDDGFGIASDSAGNAYVTGLSTSPNFPTTSDGFDTSHNGGQDVFVTKVNATGSSLAYSTFLGGGGNDQGTDITLDLSGSFYVIGVTQSADFPTTAGAFDTTHNGGDDAFITKFSPDQASTAGCGISNHGWIIAANGDRATFGGHAEADANGVTEGRQSFVDHGPAQRLSMHSISVDTIVCEGPNASIFGQATVDGSSVDFRINLHDAGVPGKGQDTYQLIVGDYDSGVQTLGGGNIKIRQN